MKGEKSRLDLLILISPPLIALMFVFLFDKFLFLLVPSLLLTWLMPVYVGYWRGAINLDSDIERIRGLVYFLLGLFSYGFFALMVALVHPLSIPGPFDELALLVILFTIVPLILWSRIGSELTNALEGGEDERIALKKSFNASQFMGWSLYGYVMVAFVISKLEESSLNIPGFVILLGLFIGSTPLFWKSIEGELKARKISAEAD